MPVLRVVGDVKWQTASLVPKEDRLLVAVPVRECTVLILSKSEMKALDAEIINNYE